MFELTLALSTVYGDLLVTAEVERGHYTIGTVRRADGSPMECTLDVLEEIETSIGFDAQCSRYDALYFACDTPELLAFHA
ncbi:MAG TPA: hypothetical protein VGB53_05770 [Rubricoccaceae bacterium]|jgi:hypothetical protein